MRAHLGLYVIGLLMAVGAALYPMWYLQGTGRLKLFALLTGGSRLVALVGLVLTVRSVDQIGLAVFWQFLPYLLCAVVCWAVMTGQKDVSLRLSRPSEARAALNDSLPLFVNLIGGQVIVNSSVILLGQLAGYRQVGLFGPADRLVERHPRRPGRGRAGDDAPRVGGPRAPARAQFSESSSSGR